MDGTEQNSTDNGITANLKSEMQRTYQDNNRLPILVEVTEKSNSADDELLEKAKRLIELLTEKKNLKDAISQKEIALLEKTLKRIEGKGLKEKLKIEYDEGSRLLSRLQTNERMRHEVNTVNNDSSNNVTRPGFRVRSKGPNFHGFLLGSFELLGILVITTKLGRTRHLSVQTFEIDIIV